MPADAPVGGYQGYVRLPAGGNKHDSVWEMEKEIVILFNPWCKGRSGCGQWAGQSFSSKSCSLEIYFGYNYMCMLHYVHIYMRVYMHILFSFC